MSGPEKRNDTPQVTDVKNYEERLNQQLSDTEKLGLKVGGALYPSPDGKNRYWEHLLAHSQLLTTLKTTPRGKIIFDRIVVGLDAKKTAGIPFTPAEHSLYLDITADRDLKRLQGTGEIPITNQVEIKKEYKHPNPKAVETLIGTFHKNLGAVAPGNMIRAQALDDFEQAMQTIPASAQTPNEKKLLELIRSQ